MKWPAKYTQVEPKDGDTRLERRFAWAPVYIDGSRVWLQYYEILQVLRISEEKVVIDGEPFRFYVKTWINLAKRCK